MPQILIVTDSPESAGEVIYRENITAVHLAPGHSGDQLIERLAWAVGDAAQAEQRADHGRPTGLQQPDLRVA